MNVFMIISTLFVTAWGVTLLLLSAFQWDWLAKHPYLFLDKMQRWVNEFHTPEYDSGMKKKAIIRGSIITVIGIVMLVIFGKNAYDLARLRNSTNVNAGEVVSLAGGELIFRDYVTDDSITVIKQNPETGQYENRVIRADSRNYGEALVAFTGIFTNTTNETLVLSENDIKVLGVSRDSGRGGSISGSWMADHNVDAEGNVVLDSGESAFLYFWLVLNRDQQSYPYSYVVHDGENQYRVILLSLRSVSGGALMAERAYEAVQETVDNAEQLAFETAYYDSNIGYVTLQDILFKEGTGVPREGSYFYLSKEAEYGKIYMDLVFEVESQNRLQQETQFTRWILVAVTADGNVNQEEAVVSIIDEEDPVKEGERYRSQVHYEIQVPEEARDFEIIVSLGGTSYIMDYERWGTSEGREDLVFGQPYFFLGGELTLDRAEYLQAVSYGRYVVGQEPNWDYVLNQDQFLFTITGELRNPGSETIYIDEAAVSVYGIWDFGEMEYGYFGANSHKNNDDIIELGPGECTMVYLYYSVDENVQAEKMDLQMEYESDIIRIAKDSLEQALESTQKADVRQAGRLEGELYTNDLLGFSYALPETWSVQLRESGEQADINGLKSAMAMYNTGNAFMAEKAQQRLYEAMETLNYFRVLVAGGETSMENLRMDAIPLVALEGRTLEEFLYDYQEKNYIRAEADDAVVELKTVRGETYMLEPEGGSVAAGDLTLVYQYRDSGQKIQGLSNTVIVFQRDSYVILIDVLVPEENRNVLTDIVESISFF